LVVPCRLALDNDLTKLLNVRPLTIFILTSIWLSFYFGPTVRAQVVFSSQQNRILNYSDHTSRDHSIKDFNGDGQLDIVSTNAYEVLFYEGIGNDQFEFPVQISVIGDSINYIRELHSADFDDDGDEDILLVLRSSTSWLENKGNADFKAIQNLFSDTSAHRIDDVVHLNDDGRPDLVVREASGLTTSIIMNYGKDSLVKIPLDTTVYLDVTEAISFDYDHNDTNDLILISRSFSRYYVYLFRALSDEKFDTAVQLYSGLVPGSVPPIVLDMDGDEQMDILIAESLFEGSKWSTLSWYESSLDGSLSKVKTYKSMEIRYMTTCDFDQDGNVDVLHIDSEGKKLNWLKSDENQNFIENGDFDLGGSNPYIYPIAIDMNQDKWPDILIRDESLYWLKNLNSKELVHKEIANSVNWITNVQVADMNKDGLADVVFSHSKRGSDIRLGNKILVCFNDDKTFNNAVEIHDDTSKYGHVFINDLNGDKFPDIIASLPHDKKLIWIKNDGNEKFSPAQTLASFKGEIKDVDLVDIDNDGDLDIAITEKDSIHLHLLINNRTMPMGYSKILMDNITLNEIKFTDIDGDQDLDIIGVGRDEKSVYRLLDLGTGQFDAKLIHVASAKCGNPQSADLDGDGDLDVLLAGRGSGSYSIAWLENLGKDSFNSIKTLSNWSGNVYNFIHSDYDQDGDEDIIYSLLTSSGQRIHLLENMGGANFEYREIVRTSVPFISPLAAVDLNSDGYEDLIIPYDKKLIWLENVSGNPTIFGVHFYDANQNGVRDSSERGISIGRTTLTPNDVAHYTNNKGEYTYYLYPGKYEIEYDSLTAPDWNLTSDSSVYHLSLDKSNPNRELDFGLYPNSFKNDATVVIPSDRLPCRNNWIDILFTNTGTTVLKGKINLSLDSRISEGAKLRFVPNPDFNEGDSLISWNFNDIFPTDRVKIRCFIVVNDGIVDILTPGDLLTGHAYAEYESSVGKDTVHYTSDFIFRCAFDPNRKVTNPYRDSIFNFTLKSEKLIYTIHFQNTGNDTATSVTITDSISEFLNLNTFKFLGSSHEENISISLTDPDVFSFTFKNIMLPDSGADFENSMGYLSFQIYPKDNLPDSSKVFNGASIYFDRNPPIHTPKVLNTLVENLPIPHVDSSENLAKSFRIYPNPSTGVITVEIPDLTGQESIKLYNLIGQLVAEFSPTKSIDTYSVRHLKSGIYFVHVVKNDQILGTNKMFMEPD
jgi:Secretion system C-terminal sorting domain/FG-GAP-like repeat